MVPKDVWEFEQSSKWPRHWLGNVSMKLKDNNKKKIGNFISWFPYILLAFILILSRTNDNLNKLLKSVNLSFLNIFWRGKNKCNFSFIVFSVCYSLFVKV